MLRVWAAFTAILGIMWPMGFGLDTPANVPRKLSVDKHFPWNGGDWMCGTGEAGTLTVSCAGLTVMGHSQVDILISSVHMDPLIH